MLPGGLKRPVGVASARWMAETAAELSVAVQEAAEASFACVFFESCRRGFPTLAVWSVDGFEVVKSPAALGSPSRSAGSGFSKFVDIFDLKGYKVTNYLI